MSEICSPGKEKKKKTKRIQNLYVYNISQSNVERVFHRRPTGADI